MSPQPTETTEDRPLTAEEKFAELEASGLIDAPTFQQILEMDDDDDDVFSRQIVNDFFDQAEQTFEKMDQHLANKELAALADLGHFLKGSSATLGLVYVRDSCEKIQHFGSHKDATGTHEEPDAEVCLERLTTTIKQAKKEFGDVEKVLRKYYKEP